MSQEQPPIRSRRELRQARDERLEAGREPGTAAPGAVGPASKPPAPQAGAGTPAGPGEPTAAEITARSRRVADGPVDYVRTPVGAERSSQIRARDRAALRTIKELAEKEGNLAAGGPPTRRQLRLMQLAAETAPATGASLTVPAADLGAPGPEGQPDGMTAEQALAARELLAQQAHNQLAKMKHIVATDPDAVDPEVLAEQIALAERIAVLNRRAAAKQKLAEQASQPAPPRNDPSAASNLAMVTPMEFEHIPGVEVPVMKRPATSHVPVVTHPGPRVEGPRKSGGRHPGASRQRTVPATGRAGMPASGEAVAEDAPPAATRADPAVPPAAVANAAEEEFAGRNPVAANSAYGLDPLDAATAGLSRARRLRIVQVGVTALGILALIAGITLIITGLAG
ncbi:hypothetical protein QFZ65_001824 [Arthrobacter sp. B3I9]|uniref:hypothetical protein n=1 Tax=Arthrobacter sp. B3I9 TaxID=3042270 RepID=UPI002791BC69|nr:hypothetical protein [Arthrobacter sp. B3I9]MDQ0849886.1 hypothetical protein [Arthrobacter sp. B3I9]